jgi:hypothetical protein
LLFAGGAVGTGAELLLLDHTEDLWQQAPIALVAFGCVMLAIVAGRPRKPMLRIFQGVMVLYLVSGALGTGLHLLANLEFEREIDPDAAGLTLFWEAVRGAMPTLAPGTMTLLGGIGLLYTYRHPASSAS